MKNLGADRQVFGRVFIGTSGTGVFVATPVCEAPDGLSSSLDGLGNVDLSWNPVESAVNYTLYGRIAGTSGKAKKLVAGTSITIPGITGGVTYQWVVRTLCGDGSNSEISGIQTFSTPLARVAESPSLVATADLLEWEMSSSGVVELYNLNGQLMRTSSSLAGSWSLSGLDPGLYVGVLRSEAEVVYKKISVF